MELQVFTKLVYTVPGTIRHENNVWNYNGFLISSSGTFCNIMQNNFYLRKATENCNGDEKYKCYKTKSINETLRDVFSNLQVTLTFACSAIRRVMNSPDHSVM